MKHILSIALLGLLPSPCFAQGLDCSSTAVVQKAKAGLIQEGRSDPDWLVRIGLHVPYFKMQDVGMEVKAIASKGMARKGPDCQMSILLTPPVYNNDVAYAKPVLLTFSYVIVASPDGTFFLDRY